MLPMYFLVRRGPTFVLTPPMVYPVAFDCIPVDRLQLEFLWLLIAYFTMVKHKPGVNCLCVCVCACNDSNL